MQEKISFKYVILFAYDLTKNCSLIRTVKDIILTLYKSAVSFTLMQKTYKVVMQNILIRDGRFNRKTDFFRLHL